MNLDEMKEKHQALTIQRGQLKDQVEVTERQLGVLAFAIGAVEEDRKEDE